MLLLFVLLGILLPLRTNSIVEPEAQWIDRDRYGSGKTIVRLGQEQERCEIIWVRCNESVTSVRSPARASEGAIAAIREGQLSVKEPGKQHAAARH